MNTTNEYYWKKRNFDFEAEADRAVWEKAKRSGLTMTKVVEDLILDVRQYDPKTESILADAAEAGENRKAFIQKAIQFYAEFGEAVTAKESDATGRRAPPVGKKAVRSKP